MFRHLISALSKTRHGTLPRRVARDVESLECQARSAAPDSRAHLYNRIGDLCVKSGDIGRALSYYGRALDVYLETGYFDAGAAMCRKMIDASPEVVRARCTLAFLTLGKGLRQDALKQITDYVDAAQRQGQEELAIERLRLMAGVTDDQEIRLLLGEYLTELGDAETANEVLGAVYAERNRLNPAPSLEDQRERWARSLRTAITSGTQDAAGAYRAPEEPQAGAAGRTLDFLPGSV